MSRVGKKTVALAAGITAKLEQGGCAIESAKGKKFIAIPSDIDCKIDESGVTLNPKILTVRTRAMWGTCRALINNAVAGFSTGFKKTLELKGVGYRASIQGNQLNLVIGYSHPVLFDIPSSVKITCPTATVIEIEGSDKQEVGQVSANIKAFKKPDSYHGHGILEKGQVLHLKVVKKK